MDTCISFYLEIHIYIKVFPQHASVIFACDILPTAAAKRSHEVAAIASLVRVKKKLVSFFFAIFIAYYFKMRLVFDRVNRSLLMS